MTRSYPGWEILNDWGNQYHNEVLNGRGIDEDSIIRLKNRSSLQVKLANDIVDGSLGLIKKVGLQLLDKRGFEMPNEYNASGRARLSLHGLYIVSDIGDLVSYGCEGLIKGLHNYDPAKSRISTFIAFTSASKMYREASKLRTIISLPTGVYDRALKIIRTSKNKREAISRICYQNDDKTVKMSPRRATMLYEIMRSNHINIDGLLGSEGDSPSSEKWADRYLPDEDAIKGDDIIHANELAEQTRKVLSQLTEREGKVLSLRFGIGREEALTMEGVAQDFYVTRERIRQIEAKALRKMRHPARTKLLKDLVRSE